MSSAAPAFPPSDGSPGGSAGGAPSMSREQMLAVVRAELQRREAQQRAQSADQGDLRVTVDAPQYGSPPPQPSKDRPSAPPSSTFLRSPASPAYTRFDSPSASGRSGSPVSSFVADDSAGVSVLKDDSKDGSAQPNNGGTDVEGAGAGVTSVQVPLLSATPFSVLSFDSRGRVMAPIFSASNAPIAFGVWAYYLALSSAGLCLFFGPLSILWWYYSTSPLYTDDFNIGAGIYAIVVGCVILYEEFLGLPLFRAIGRLLDTMASRYNFRSLLYSVLSGVLFLSYPTVVPAVAMLCAAFINRIACAEGERFQQGLVRPTPRRQVEGGKKAPGVLASIFKEYIAPIWDFAVHVRHRGAVGIVLWLAIYTVGNVLLFVYTLKLWIDRVGTSRQEGETDPNALVLSYWLAPAKAFGLLLDLNCAIILLPVCRTLIRWLYVQSTKDQSRTTLALRYVLRLVPLDYHVHFHRIIAFVIVLAAVGHTFAHFVNFALRPSVTIAVLGGPWSLISGGLLILVVLLMYSAAFPRVRAARFELFFEIHHLFIIFFILLLVHGAHGVGPNFWKYFIGPAVLYGTDRLLRIVQGRRAAELRSVQFMQDVMCLEFGKVGVFAKPYKPGQYLTLQCPAISPLQWHPFTISTAPGDPTVTVHIKIKSDNPAAFTYRVAAYLASMDPTLNRTDLTQWGYIKFDRPNPRPTPGNLRLPGRTEGPDQRPLFRITGPFAAPTQHLSEYSVAMVVGAGIGVTPLSACMRQVVQYEWGISVGQTFPSRVFFVWLVAHGDLDGFRWMLRLIRKTQLKVNRLRAMGAMAQRTFEVHIYVTSPPRDKKDREVDAMRVLDEMRTAKVAADRMPNRDAPPRTAPVDDDDGVKMLWDDYRLALSLLVASVKATDPEGMWLTSEPSPDDLRGRVDGAGSGGSFRLDDVRVYTGRPDWKNVFSSLSKRYPKDEIGVMFCGPEPIANDLREQRWRQNARRGSGKIKFTVHCENF